MNYQRSITAITISILTFFQSAVAQDKEGAGDLPKVLIIGDSISIGYTGPVKELLKGKADVSRPKANCAFSANGVKFMKRWMGDTKWDVIHFNFGIWDTHFLGERGKIISAKNLKAGAKGKRRVTTEQYVENLKKVVEVMEASGAKLIWASTTPWLTYGEDTKALILKNNAAAVSFMESKNIPINDLYTLAINNQKWLSGDGVHFTKAGSKELAKQVAASIEARLEKK